MRVAVISWSSRRVGGVEDYVSILIPAMRRAGLPVAFWHEVDAPQDRLRIEVPSEVADICAADLGLETSIQQLRAWKPDILYMQGLNDTDVERRLLEIAPAVFFLHTYVGTCISGTKMFARPRAIPCDRTFGLPCLLHYFPHGCGGNSPKTMWRLYATQSERLRLFHHYAAILTISDHMRDEMAKHGLRADVVPYPVTASVGGSSFDAADASLNADSSVRLGKRWHLLYAGRMERLKGGHYFIEALPEVVRSSGRAVHVTFAGDGRDRPSWDALARRVQASTPDLSIDFTGWLQQKDLGALMNKADLLVVPSLWPEPLGAVGPAAAQHGLPAAAFATGGIPHWLADRVSGHLAPADPPTPAGLARAIIQCLEDPAHYAALRGGARQMAAHFTMDQHLPVLLERLNQVSERPRASARDTRAGAASRA